MAIALKQALKKSLLKFGFEIRRVSCGNGQKLPAHNFDVMFERLYHLSNNGFFPKTICDAGASDGIWSRRCMEVFPEACYFCVDPLVENEAALTNLSAQHENLDYWIGCLGAEEGTVTLNADGDGSSVLTGHANNLYGDQRTVRMETLDSLVLKNICPAPELLKIDVQGYELEVLKGAANTLKTTQAIVMEVSFFPFQTNMPVFHDVVGQVAEHGFAVADILSLSQRPLDNLSGQCDLLFMRFDHPLRQDNRWSCDSVY